MITDQSKQRLKDAIELSSWIREGGVDLKPAGQDEWKGLCPFHNEKTPSFTVNDRKQFFHCFGCGADGDIFSWLDQRQNLPFKEAANLIANRVGIALDHASDIQSPSQALAKNPRPAPQREDLDADRFRPLDDQGPVFRYLVEERKISREALQDYRVVQTREADGYAFPYKERRGQRTYTQFLKVVKLKRKTGGQKDEYRHPKGGKNILFGMIAAEDMSPERDSLIITEGELDALSWATYGYPAVSIPCGANSTAWIETNYEWLQDWKTLHINFDEDRAGRAKVEEVVKRLGIERTDIIRLPLKETEIEL